MELIELEGEALWFDSLLLGGMDGVCLVTKAEEIWNTHPLRAPTDN